MVLSREILDAQVCNLKNLKTVDDRNISSIARHVKVDKSSRQTFMTFMPEM